MPIRTCLPIRNRRRRAPRACSRASTRCSRSRCCSAWSRDRISRDEYAAREKGRPANGRPFLLTMAESWDDFVRRVDFDRYLSSLFAPHALRAELNVLYAFNYEVAKTAETVSQPIAGQIRLQWWRDRISELYRGVAVEHPVVQALDGVISRRNLPRGLFDALIDAREHDLEEAPFATIDEFEAYADTTSG